MLLVTRKLLGAPGIATRNKKLLGATKGIATSHKDAIRGSWHRRQEKKLLGPKGIATTNKTPLGAPGIATRNKKRLGAKGIATSNKGAIRGSWHRY